MAPPAAALPFPLLALSGVTEIPFPSPFSKPATSGSSFLFLVGGLELELELELLASWLDTRLWARPPEALAQSSADI